MQTGAAVLLLITVAPLLAAGPGVAPTAQHRPDRAEISHAIDIVKADPNLATDRTIRTLQWANATQAAPSDQGNLLVWLLQLAGWFAQTARFLVWVAAAVLVGLLAIFLLRLWRSRVPSAEPGRKLAPTHVLDLDIRPESLPEDIGATARTLWDRGERRAALSLLYRGLLSRLVHVHNIPIRDSSTEGDTLLLTAGRLGQDKRHYATRLIGVWQHSVYGGQEPETGLLYVLCDEFAPALDVI